MQSAEFNRDGEADGSYILTTELDLLEKNTRGGRGKYSKVLELKDREDQGESSCEIEWVDRDSSWYRAGARRGFFILEVAGVPVNTKEQFDEVVRCEAKEDDPAAEILLRKVSFTKQWDAAVTEANVTTFLEISGDPLLGLFDNCTVFRTPPEGSPAERAKLTIGCRITNVEGTAVSRKSDFYRLIAEKRRDGFDVCKITFTRVSEHTPASAAAAAVEYF